MVATIGRRPGIRRRDVGRHPWFGGGRQAQTLERQRTQGFSEKPHAERRMEGLIDRCANLLGRDRIVDASTLGEACSRPMAGFGRRVPGTMHHLVALSVGCVGNIDHRQCDTASFHRKARPRGLWRIEAEHSPALFVSVEIPEGARTAARVERPTSSCQM